MHAPEFLLRGLRTLPSYWIEYVLRKITQSEGIRFILYRREAHHLRQVDSLRRVLCISDVNLGDAVNLQRVPEVITQHRPRCEVDYVHSRIATPLVQNNPSLSRSIPLFKGRFIPESSSADELRKIALEGSYDLIFNFCPFLSGQTLKNVGCPVLSPMRLVSKILLHVLGTDSTTAALGNRLEHYVEETLALAGTTTDAKHGFASQPPRIYLQPEARRIRDKWMRKAGVNAHDSIVIFNPDASNEYTLVDEDLQVGILTRVLESQYCDQVLLASGFTFAGIEQRIVNRLSSKIRSKVTLIPQYLPIDAYAALLDTADVFVSADTGPLHLASAQKKNVCGSASYNNTTAVCSLFGPTLPEIYGYDSRRDDYADSGQNAPARVFTGRCPNKTVGCSLARITERCNRTTCFQGLNRETVARFVIRELKTRASFPNLSTHQKGRA